MVARDATPEEVEAARVELERKLTALAESGERDFDSLFASARRHAPHIDPRLATGEIE